MIQFQKGDTVRLAQSVIVAEFNLALCDDDGEPLEIDGVVVEVLPQLILMPLNSNINNLRKNYS